MKKKTYRKTIRINGEEIKSPRFFSKEAAEKWYREQHTLKSLVAEGVSIPLDKKTTLNKYFLTKWLPSRKEEYTKATWGPDEQRYKDYVGPKIGNLKVAKINSLQIKSCLKEVTSVYKLSSATRNRVRSLLSKLFGDAMNEDPPLRSDNPALNITFQEARVGKRRPHHLSRQNDIFKFLNGAKVIEVFEQAYMSFALCSTFLMSAIRKSELIALTWDCFDPEAKELHIRARFVQAERKIMSGTKGGRVEVRVVSISDALVDILVKWKSKSQFVSDDDFIFSKEGKLIPPRDIARVLEMVSKESGVKASPHALRHSYGRWFVANGGSIKALQAQLGHSSSNTTELYSELAAEQVKKDRNIVSFNISGDDK